MLNLLTMKSDFFKNRVFHGFIYFLMLVALAMTLINPIIVLLPAIFMAVVSFVFVIPEYTTGYIAVALSVCKNE
jgi:hypothetical protein